MTAKRLFAELQNVLPEVANQVTVYRESRTSKDTIFLTMAGPKNRDLVFKFISGKDWSLSTRKGEV